MYKRPVATIALLFCLVAPAVGTLATAINAQEGLVSQGEAAYQKGDYAAALRIWQPAANQGEARAQFDLGVMHANGKGVPQDYVLAHMWFNLSAARGDATAAEYRDKLAQDMSPAQIAEAQRMAREWKPNRTEPASKPNQRRPHR